MFTAYSIVFLLMVVVIHVTGICPYADQLIGQAGIVHRQASGNEC